MARATLEYIELSNFKSFGGVQRFGRLVGNVIAVIGSNGAGKSNLADAVSFVLGGKAVDLRVDCLGSLVHGAAVNDLSLDPVYVKASFVLRPAVEVIDFTRQLAVKSSGLASMYLINNKDVTKAEYLAGLARCGLNVRAKNFLIFQGQIEQVATMSPMDLTALLEELCGSIEFKADYDRLKNDMEAARYEERKYNQLLTTARNDYSKLSKLVNEVDHLDGLRKQWHEEECQVALNKLYENDLVVRRLNADGRKIRDDLQTAVNDFSSLSRNLKSLESQYHRLENELHVAEESRSCLNVTLATCRGACAADTEIVDAVQKKIQLARSAVALAKAQLEDTVKQISDLQTDLKSLDQQTTEGLTGSDNSSVDGSFATPATDQIASYHKLRSAVKVRARDELESELSLQGCLSEISFRMNRIEEDLTLMARKVEKENAIQKIAEEQLVTIENNICSIKDTLNQLQRSSGKHADIERLQRELREIIDEEHTDNIDRRTLEIEAKKTEVVEELKASFGGILGRLSDLCRPCHQRYRIALAKIMGHSMDALVCNNVETARGAIEYLKKRQYKPEMFLACDYLQVKPISSKMRATVCRLKKAQLAFDVVQYDPEIRDAVLYSVGMAVICPSVDDARLAASSESGTRFRAVSMDGILFEPSGIVSGGLADLERSAKRFDRFGDDLRQRDIRKKALIDKLAALKKDCRNQNRDVLQSNMATYQNLLQYAEKRKSFQEKVKEDIKTRLEQLNRDLHAKQTEKQELQCQIDGLNQQLITVRQAIMIVENDVYHDFCQQIGVQNIREYRERLKSYERNEEKRIETDAHAERLRVQIDFDTERKGSLQLEVEKNERTLLLNEKMLKDVTMKAEDHKKELDSLLLKSSEADQSVAELRKELDLLTDKLRDLKTERRTAETKIADLKVRQSSSNLKLEERREERRSILFAAKESNIEIPLINGSLNDVAFMTETLALEQEIEVDFSNVSDLFIQAIALSSCAFSLSAELAEAVNLGLQTMVHDILLERDNMNKQQRQNFIKQMECHATKLRSEIDVLHGDIGSANIKKKSSLAKQLKARKCKHQESIKKLQHCTAQLERVGQERARLFMQCFNRVANSIDGVYQELVQRPGAAAVLDLEEGTEPFLGGTHFGCMPPGKRYRKMDDLSGGEKTIASLALIFSMQRFKPSPFIIMDEVDAALDGAFIDRVVDFIHKSDSQFVVISHRLRMCSRANALTGIYTKIIGGKPTSVIAQAFLDLDRYAAVDEDVREENRELQ